MRKVAGSVLALVGAFLLVVGILAQFYATDRLKRTPIDSDSVTNLSGTAQLTDGENLNTLDVLAWSVTKSDSEKSTDDVVVYANSSCLVKDEGDIDGCVSAEDPGDRLLSASTDDFATDRITAEAVNDPDQLPAAAVPHEGLVNKWPFEAEEKTYLYWDSVIGEAVDAEFEGREKLEGHETLVYRVTVVDAPVELTDGVFGTYSDDKAIYIDPYTGSIIHQIDHQERVDSDGEPFLTLDLAFTDEQVKDNIDSAKSSTRALKLVTETVPLIGYIVGIPLLVIGIWLMSRARRQDDSAAEELTDEFEGADR